MSDERVELWIRGVVQGVAYRASTAAHARKLGLVGWVRNEHDGSVRALAEGPRAQLEALVAWCRRGPPAARVDTIDIEWSPATGEHDDFVVTR